nr:microtubule-associated protein 70-2-like [Ziziphus jujuba var. spinosa]
MANSFHINDGEAKLPKPPPSSSFLSSSAPFRARKKPSAAAGSDVDDIITLLHGSDPVRVELNRLKNEVRDKDRELGDALAEIKSLKNSERLKEKAVEELTDELNKVDRKLKATEALLESKNLEIKKINDEKKAALAAQYAAEATLRRVHAAQKDDELPPIEAIVTPLEAKLKLARQEVAKLQDDNRALDRLTKSKEAALLQAERIVEIAVVKTTLVDDLLNKNQELMKQIEICQEENKILDKMHRKKVAEVEKLTQTVHELEESVLAGGAAANSVRDFQRKVQEMNEEKKTLEREVARAKVSANRVATLVANEWKDGNDKVMPVKQWLEERKFIQGEMQQLRDKLTVAERTAKAEAHLKEKYRMRFKVLEDTLKASNGSSQTVSESRSISNGHSRRQSLGAAENSRLSPNGYTSRKIASPQLVAQHSNSAKPTPGATEKDNAPTIDRDDSQMAETIGRYEASTVETPIKNSKAEHEDYVSGMLYDMLQKEVVSLRKACHEKDQILKDKDDAIELLAKKVDTLNKAMEAEAKKMRREVAAIEKEVAVMRVGRDHDQRMRCLSAPRAAVNGSDALSARNARKSWAICMAVTQGPNKGSIFSLGSTIDMAG